MKRGQSGLSCLLAVDKPLHMTSHDVVDRVRRISHERRVGHAGTLDPAASGLLCLGIGPATRLLPYLSGQEKRYLATVAFGRETDTDDAEGRVTAEAPIPSQLYDAVYAETVLSGFLGVQEQLPPQYSAIKKEGVKAYEAARKGEGLELETRTIEVTQAQLLGIREEPLLMWDIEFSVSKGSYIRALARDIGRACNSCAHLAALRRKSAGSLTLDDCVSLDALEERGVEACALDPILALGLPQADIEEAQVVFLEQGKRLDAPKGTPQGLVSVVSSGRLRSIHECQGGLLVPKTVIVGGVGGGQGTGA